MKQFEININEPTIGQNVQLISKIGSNLGTQFFKVDVRMAWQGGQEGFEKDKKAIESGEKNGFILNRSPRRFIAKNFLITGTVLVKNPISEEVEIAINPHEDGSCDISLPINPNTLETMGKTTAAAIGEAIRGEKDHFFIDGKTLARLLNDEMRREVTRLEEHITSCQKMITTLKGDIANNDTKARIAEEQWVKSAIPQNVDFRGGKACVTVTEKDE